jgi:hypothetical protein
MAGDNLRRSPSSRPATMLVIDGDTGLDLLLKKVIQEFDLGLTLCQISTRDLDFAALVFSPDIVWSTWRCPGSACTCFRKCSSCGRMPE